MFSYITILLEDYIYQGTDDVKIVHLADKIDA
jgi:hypothetical protein